MCQKKSAVNVVDVQTRILARNDDAFEKTPLSRVPSEMPRTDDRYQGRRRDPGYRVVTHLPPSLAPRRYPMYRTGLSDAQACAFRFVFAFQKTGWACYRTPVAVCGCRA